MVFGSVTVVVLVGIAGAAVLGAVAAWKRDVKSRGLRWGVTGAAAALGLVAAIVLMGASHLVRVRRDMTTVEQRLLGSTTETIDGREVEISSHGSGMTVIVNESDRVLDLRTLVYGELAPGAMVPPDETVAPRSVFNLHANLDYVGPNDRPPSSISTKGGGKVKHWLTW